MFELHDIIVCAAIAAMASGALLLKRFLYPFLFPYLPTWKSAYITSGLIFVGLFVSLLLS